MDPLDPRLLTYPQFQNQLRIEFSRARRYRYPLALAAFQVDRLDSLCDLYGTASKREILQRVVQVVQAQTRVSDTVGTQGDRVLLILPHTGEDAAKGIAERLAARIAGLEFRCGDRTLAVTLAVGVAGLGEEGPIFYDALLKGALAALADAAELGGNQVAIHRPPRPPPEDEEL